MKYLFVSLIALLASCSKEDVLQQRPIKKDITAPTISISSSSDVTYMAEDSVTIVVEDDMGLKEVYFYDSDGSSRSWSKPYSPGIVAKRWELKFSVLMSRQETKTMKAVVYDLAGNMSETTATINCSSLKIKL